MKKGIACLLAALLLLCAAGCRQKTETPAAAPTNLGAVMQEMLDTVTLPEMMTLTPEDMTDYFGLDAQWCADSAACINANGYEKDEIILVRAADADSVQQITDCLQHVLDNAAAEMQNYLPDQYAMIRKCSVQSRNLYVWLFISDETDQLQTILDKYL